MIKKLFCLCLCLMSFVWMTTADAAPPKKKTVAIPAVGIACDGRWGDEAATLLHGELVSALVNSGTCEVLERTRLNSVMNELNLQNSGAIDGSTAIRFGQLSGAQYTVCATVYEANVGEFSNYLYKGTKAKVKVDFRFIDNKTGKILTDKMIEGSKTVSEYEDSTANHRMLISRAVSDAAKEIIEELKGTTVGVVIKVNGETAYVDIGTEMGVQPKDKYVIYRVGEALVHPVTGEIMGAEEIEIGELVITEAKLNYSIGMIKKCDEPIKTGDQVKRLRKK